MTALKRPLAYGRLIGNSGAGVNREAFDSVCTYVKIRLRNNHSLPIHTSLRPAAQVFLNPKTKKSHPYRDLHLIIRMGMNGLIKPFSRKSQPTGGNVNRVSLTVKVVPRPSSLSTSSQPPWDSRMVWTMESPNPVPSGLLVKKGSKI